MFCPNCGTYCEDNQKFCSNCGSALIVPTGSSTRQAPDSQADSFQADPFQTDSRSTSGQTDYTQSAYGQTDYTQSAYGQTDYTQSAHGQTDYTQSAYGQNDYTQSAYGQADYSQPGYQQNYVPPRSEPQPPYSPYGQTGYDVRNNMYTGIMPRSIPLYIILTIVTCGLFSIYWMYRVNEDVNLLANEPNATTGGMVILFTIITCGIYGIYWAYKMGERVDRIKGENGSSAILYLVLALFGLSIIDYALIQDVINKTTI